MSSPVATYSYDQTSFSGLSITNGTGRRTGMTDQAGSVAWSFDPMGRVLSDRRTTNSLSNTFSYAYNLDGSQLTEVHPILALTINFVQGGAGRLTSETSADAGYATNVHYAPNGAPCYMNSGWGNTFTHIWTFNNRFQPARIQLYGTGHGASSPLCSASTDGVGSNVDLTYSYVDSSGHNNGNVIQITNNIDWHRTQSFTYDSLNRVATAQTLATNQPGYQGDTQSIQQCWAEQYSYDAWGNLLSISPSSSSSYTGCSQESGFNYTNFISTKNQITYTGFSYDAAGNLTTPPGAGTMTYDAENHLVSAGGQTYLYDGDGKRVEKASGSPLVANKLYWYGTNSEPVIETDGAGNFQYRYILFFNGMRVKREEANDWVDHYGLDALGNVRFVYGYQGASDVSDYYPFGGERPINAGTNNRYKFTSKERDSESGLDNFGARYDSSNLGRFMSADWSAAPTGVPYADFGDPQSLNLYAYVQNNPLKSTDPSGHCTVDGETHWGWCIWHSLGFYETKKEAAARQEAMAAYARYRKTMIEKYGYDPDLMMFLALTGGMLATAASTEGGGDTESTVAPEQSAASTGAEAGWVRVGRWMSTEELEQMEATNTAVESRIGSSRVAFPASPDAYKAAPKGDVYVEYDVPAGSLKPGSQGQAIISGSNSPQARLATQQGKPAPAMPPVRNITVVKKK